MGHEIGAIADGSSETANSARNRGARTSTQRLAALIGFSNFLLAAIPPSVAYLTIPCNVYGPEIACIDRCVRHP